MKAEAENLDTCTIPSGVKPFKVGFDSSSWDQPFSRCGSQTEVEFKVDCIIAEGKEALYITCLQLDRLLNVEMETHRQKNLEKEKILRNQKNPFKGLKNPKKSF